MTFHWLSRVLLLVLMVAFLLGAAGTQELSTRAQSAESMAQELDPAVRGVLPGSAGPFSPTVLTDASAPSEPPDRGSGSFGFSHYVFEQVGGEVLTTLVEGPRSG